MTTPYRSTQTTSTALIDEFKFSLLHGVNSFSATRLLDEYYTTLHLFFSKHS